MPKRKAKDPGELVWHCIICGKKVSKAYRITNPDSPRNNQHMQAVGAAVLFNANGNWASSIWDPLDEHIRMEIAICDRCLKPRLHRTYITKFRMEYRELDKKGYHDWVRSVKEEFARRNKLMRGKRSRPRIHHCQSRMIADPELKALVRLVK
jgi:hypothetical protein